jgi:formylglycine-generating enzyme required for sulfatase activity
MDNDRFRLVGTTIANKYAVLSVVEEGGFSVVYRAKHLVWNRPVAIKAFKAAQQMNDHGRDELVRSFIREGAILAELSERSTAIVQSRDVGTLTLDSGEWVPYLVLEWLEGDCLDVCLHREQSRKTPPRTLERAVSLLAPVAGALSLAHAKGITHRDIKPGNLFVLAEGGMKLLDFGIAKEHTEGTRETAVRKNETRSFTPQYAAPEQFSVGYGPTGPWTDVFALALVLVEMVTGREPLDGPTHEKMAASATDRRVRPTPRMRGIATSDAVEAVFARALAVEPMQRFRSAGDFWWALEHAMHPVEAVRRSAPPREDRTTLPNVASSVARTKASWPRRMVGFAAGAGLAAGITFVAVSPLVRRAAAMRSGSGGSTLVTTTGARVPSPILAPPPAAAPPSCPEGMAMVAGGKFFMGSDDGPAAEQPSHAVTLASYCIDVTEVTTAAFKACSDAGNCKRAWRVNDWSGISDHERTQLDGLCNANDPEGRARHPINCVDWETASLFCEARGARLPSEAEWELAARGQDGRVYPWGDEAPSELRLNACGRECVAFGAKSHIDAWPLHWKDDGFVATAPVGSFPLGQSRIGARDMVGNVSEWVADRYGAYERAPQRSPRGPSSGDARVVRGGAWNAGAASLVRSSSRDHASPTTRSHAIGFRCAASP